MSFLKALVAVAMIGSLAAVSGCKVKQQPVQTASAPPSMNFTMKTNSRSDRIRVYSTVGASQKKNRVRVCLRNSSSGRNKGLHYKNAKKPKFVVKKKNQSSCAHYKPGKRTFYLWRNTPLGKMKLRATRNLDLTGYAGQQVTFDWVQD
ncbi:MAG: hypothetical protein AAF408_00375 [Pseudomonadota bacterium]